MTRVGRILSKAGTVVLCIVVAVSVVLLVFQVFASNGKTLPGGYRPLIVLSGSMEPAIPVGSLIVSKNADPAEVKAGDIITFGQASGLTGNATPFVTHRVAQVAQGADGLSFVTKGDANNTEDMNPVPAELLVGQVVLVMPFVGHVTQFVHSPLGLILMILLPGFILIAWESVDLVKKRRKRMQRGGTAALLIVLCLAGTSLGGLIWSGPANSTEAYFAAVTQPLTCSISTGTWGGTPDIPGQTDLILTPGRAKAVRTSEMPGGPAYIPIASLDSAGALKLDFGELHPGQTNNSPDVFRITNNTDRAVEIDVVGVEGFADFIVRIGQGSHRMPVMVQPGEEYSVDIKVGVARAVEAGDYHGSLRVTATAGGTIIMDASIPAMLTVVDAGHGSPKNGAPETVGADTSVTDLPGGEIQSDQNDGTTGGSAEGDQSGSSSTSTTGSTTTTSTTVADGHVPKGSADQVEPERSNGSPPATLQGTSETTVPTSPGEETPPEVGEGPAPAGSVTDQDASSSI